MEVENNGATALNALVGALNAQVGAGTYEGITSPVPGTDEIQVAMIYKPARVRPVGAALSSTDPVFRRPPLIQEFRRRQGRRRHLVHHARQPLQVQGLRRRAGPDLDQGDGQSCYNAERVRQAGALLGLIGTLRPPNPLVSAT